MTLDAGQIILMPFPNTNLKSGKRRPALVLTDSRYNARSPDVVLAYFAIGKPVSLRRFACLSRFLPVTLRHNQTKGS